MFIRKWKSEDIKVIGRGYKVTTKFTRCGQILLSLSGVDKFLKKVSVCWLERVAEWMSFVVNFQKLIQPCRIIIEECELAMYYWGKVGPVACLLQLNRFKIICFKFVCFVPKFFAYHRLSQNSASFFFLNLLRKLIILTWLPRHK